MCRAQACGGRRCQHEWTTRGKGAHNQRRRENRAIQRNAVAWVRAHYEDDRMADELAKMNPGEVKDFLREANHDPRDFIDGFPQTTKIERTSGWVRGTGSPGGPPAANVAGPLVPDDAGRPQSPDGSPTASAATRDWHDASWSSPTLTPRVEHVLATQHGHRDERALLSGEVVTKHPVSNGANTTVRVELDNGMIGYYKSFDGLDHPLSRRFGQSDADQPLFEVAAWRIASSMGPPYDQMVPPTVLREVDGRLGSFANARPGRMFVPDVERSPEWREAALFDSLIGQQDRNPGNFLVAGDRISLIDHGFSFATPGDYQHWNYFIYKRYEAEGADPRLTYAERQVLQRVLDSPDQLGVRPLIGDRRADALRKRAEVMLERGEILNEF